MKLLIRMLRIFFTTYASIVYGISFFIVMPIYFLIFNFYSHKRAPHIAHRLSRFWAKGLYMLFFIRAKIFNKELIDPTQTYVFVANHLSFVDIPCYALSCQNTFRFLSKAELARIPVLGYIIRNLYITVNRSDKNDRSLSLKKMRQSLEENISVFLCPEGTRNQSNEPLLPFKDGAFRLAIESGKPMAVLTLYNSNKLLNPARWFELAPGIVYGIWSEPIPTHDLQEEDLEMLKSEVRNIMLKALEDFKQGKR